MVMNIMEEYPEIESCVECSARTLKNISEMFYYAQKAVLHPTGPLYVLESQDLTEECKKALTRIFKICDLDNDGLLSDTELNVFQKRCFNAPLQPQVLEDVKAVLSKNIGDGVHNNCITLKGFLFLHCLFIQRGRNETVWTVLRKFGYNDSLRVTKDYLVPSVRVPHGCTSELNHRGQHFLQKLFERHDKDRDGALSSSEMNALFMPCPSPPWRSDFGKTVASNSRGWMTLQGFMSYWSLITLLDLPLALEHLGYLGYNIIENESHANAIHVTREKSLDLAKKQSSRNVYQCNVIGHQKSGKSTFCGLHIGQTLDMTGKQSKQDTASSRLTINSVLVYGQEKQLILREVEVKNVADPLMTEDTLCDVVCLLYDGNHPKSFEYVAEIYMRYFQGSKVPVLVVASKSDLPPVRQDYIVQPDEFCSRHKLAPPHLFSAAASPTGTPQHTDKDVYVKLATMAVFPRFQAAWVLFYRHR
ncbi:mitochondrial Rho GTPase isoform X4 [Frankliniella occidentalis]|nr:mitochondrial Rho GTPase isoform X4 [Frankliniella occidentalis]